jgi:hypothetical protein
MYAQLFQGSSLVVLPLLALVFFVFVFALVVGRVLHRGAAAYEAAARLPLEASAPPSEGGQP